MKTISKRSLCAVVASLLMITSALFITGCSESDDDGGSTPAAEDLPSDMTGAWRMQYAYNEIETVATLTLNSDGSFDYSDPSITTYGTWEMSGDDFSMQFYLSTGDGSIFSGSVNEECTSITGGYVYFDRTIGSWSAER